MATNINRRRQIRKLRFISLRWRMTFPLALLIMLMAMIGAYMVASRLASGFSISEENVLLQSSQAIANRNVEEYTRLRSEAQRVAFTVGIGEAIQTQQTDSLHQSLEAMARTSALDSIIVTDTTGIEVAGILRVRNSEPIDYAISTQTDLSTSAALRAYLDEGQIGASGLSQTTQGLLVYVSVPLQIEGEFVGMVLVGQWLPTIAEAINTNGLSELTFYNADGNVLYTTVPLNTETLSELNTSPAIIRQSITNGQPTQASLDIANIPYRIVYTPFNFGDNTLGVMGTMLADNVPFATEIGRQMIALFAAMLAGASVIVVFIAVSRMTGRMDKITATAQALAGGVKEARTGLKAVDEIGSMGQALDTYAAVTKHREDNFHTMLRRQRRELNYFMAVMEAMPDGVLVQDDNGRVVMINDRARQLLGTQPDFQHPLLQLEERVTQVLGSALAPGIYALGNPQQVEHEGKMLSAQAAAVMTRGERRIGTVLLIRDITTEVQKEQKRDQLLTQLSADIQQPLASLAQSAPHDTGQMVTDFAREISRHAAALQKMIVDMRELTRYNPTDVQHKQRALQAQTLLLAVANDWRQIAQAANLDLRMIIETKGMFVLGDEARLRWAIGNIVDNAIKYTPSGGALTLEIRAVIDGMLHMRVRDNGVGISEDDLANIFMPFYRGTPIDSDGQVIRVPGMGQGLALARQVIAAHGGMMKVKTRLGVGTAVYFALPITSGESFALPLFGEDTMEGETLIIPEDVEIDNLWHKS
ncbi:MAG: ATP-binding protein [Anaerolineae bacterium]|nr:ATP-binding protein [Anaerolineae bacterium]